MHRSTDPAGMVPRMISSRDLDNIHPTLLAAVLAVLPHHREAMRGKWSTPERCREAAFDAAIEEAMALLAKLGTSARDEAAFDAAIEETKALLAKGK